MNVTLALEEHAGGRIEEIDNEMKACVAKLHALAHERTTLVLHKLVNDVMTATPPVV